MITGIALREDKMTENTAPGQSVGTGKKKIKGTRVILNSQTDPKSGVRTPLPPQIHKNTH